MFMFRLSSPKRLHWSCRIQHRHARRDGQDRDILASFQLMLKEERKPGLGILLASLKACSRLEDLQAGQIIHSFVVQNGGKYVHKFVDNALVDMYSKCGSMEVARQVFESSHSRDTVSWNCIIRGYAQCGQGEVALELYEQMLQGGQCAPDCVTVLAALKACSSIAEKCISDKCASDMKAWCLHRGRGIHSQALRAGIELDMKVGSSLVDMYANCGSMPEARQVFDKMLQRDVVCWNTIMLGYAQSGQAELSLELFSRMQEEGVVPTHVTFLAALKACASLAEKNEAPEMCLDKVKSIHKQVAGTREVFSVIMASTLVDAYAKCGSMTDACNVFERMPQRTVVSWNCMVMGYARNGEGENALEVYAQMQRTGVVADSVSTLGALKACTSLAEKGSIDEAVLLECGRAIHCQAAKSGHEDMAVASSLVDMYTKCGSMREARKVFDRMPQTDVVSWTSIILGYVRSGDTELALAFYKRLRTRKELVPDAAAFVAALKACGSLGALDSGREVHADICRAGLDKDLVLLNCLVDFYGKCASMVEAKQVFDSAAGWRDLVTWNTLITGFSLQGDAPAVMELFEMMRKEKLQPDGITFLSILSVCTHSGLVDEGSRIFKDMYSMYRVVPTIDHYTCMVDLLGRANRLQDAATMIEDMPLPEDEVIWKALLAAAQKWKNTEVAKVAFERMLKLGAAGSSYVLMANTYTG